ncbi:MAG: dimethylamine monooxygenase subunit DmmA family protein [Hyphomicrobium sp.]|mgnify:CR=1 FL=1
MLSPGIISRPVYKGLVPDPHAKHNLIAIEGEGAAAVLDMAASAPSGFFDRSTILFCATGSAGKGYEEKLKALAPASYWDSPTIPTAMFRLRGALSTASMATRLYAAGTEPFIGSVIQEALQAGIDHRSVLTEHRGSAKRRVQCVHCKGFTENVTQTPFVCSHCGLNLFVRDHYSRRLGAFQGVCVDAEVPGQIPTVEELYK